MRLPMKPKPFPASTGCFLSRFAIWKPVAIAVSEVFSPPTTFEQFHDMGGTEKVQSEHIFGPGRRRRHGIDIEVGRVRCEDSFRFDHGVELFEHRPFGVHILDDRLNDEIAVCQSKQIGLKSQVGPGCVMGRWGEFSTLSASLEIGLDPSFRTR